MGSPFDHSNFAVSTYTASITGNLQQGNAKHRPTVRSDGSSTAAGERHGTDNLLEDCAGVGSAR